MQPVFKPRREREAQVVAPSLDKDKPEILPVPQEECLQNDLEERARKQTIDDLTQQGIQYAQFNKEVLSIVQPEEERRKLEDKIRISTIKDKAELDKIQQEAELIKRGSLLQKRVREV